MDAIDPAAAVVALIFGFALMLPLWLVFGIKVLGTTEHTWMSIRDSEQAELEARDAQVTKGSSKGRPEGKALYSRATWGAYGATVYRNGLFAAWHVGRKSKYRFVPLSDLAAIYPIEMTIRMWWRKGGYEGIQLETGWGLTLPVDSIRHDVPRFRRALAEALGASYEQLWKPDKPIRTALFDGRMGLPAAIRTRGAPTAPSITSGMWAKEEDAVKGELVLEEGEGDFQLRLQPLRRIGWSSVAVAAACGVAAAASYPSGTLIWALVSLAAATFALLMREGLRSPAKRAQLFEQGVMAYAQAGGIFYAFAEVKSVEERRGIVSGRYYLFFMHGGWSDLRLPARCAFGDRAAEAARQHIAERGRTRTAAKLPP